jgi:hypothetical protein
MNELRIKKNPKRKMKFKFKMSHRMKNTGGNLQEVGVKRQ